MKKLTLPNGEVISYIDKLTALDVYDEIYVENEYLRHDIEVNDNDVIFDIGANIGLFSRYVAMQAKNLQIFTFEPVPIIFDVLEENLKNLPAEVKNYNVGLAEREEITHIHYYPNVSADSAIIEFDWDLKVEQYLLNYDETVADWFQGAESIPESKRKDIIEKILKDLYKAELVQCKLRTISDIIQENDIKTINLMKIDAENYEFQVLSGINQTDWEKIHQITMEVHEHIQGGKNLLKKLSKMLEEKGFQVKKGLDSRFSLMGVYMLYAKRH
ncbi:MAG: FkbM family methyltransferase [Candidatus Lokiarchaeota archaeon]|nr:FkbM family methyltransferase [Candidatus Lokiarchaeota archaeon]